MARKNKLSVISLFSGCGGLDLGFHKSGYAIQAAYDINPIAVDTYNRNISNHASVLDLSNADTFPMVESPNVLLSGSPCQGFSVAGKRAVDDPRNDLLLQAGKIALRLKPDVFLAENVPGVLSGAHKIYWDDLENSLRSNGYDVSTIKVSALDFGAAQQRKRIFMIAWKSKSQFSIRPPSMPPATLRCAIENIPDGIKNHVPRYIKSDTDDYRIASKIKMGMKLSNVRAGSASLHTWDIPDVFGVTTKSEKELLNKMIRLRRQIRVRDYGDADPVPLSVLEKEFGSGVYKMVDSLVLKGYLERHSESVDLTNTFNGKYRRLSWDKPSCTVDTYFGNPRYFLHPTEHRGFTVREAARIQGFPDDFVFYGSESQNFQMIGNAVSPAVSEYLANLVRKLV